MAVHRIICNHLVVSLALEEFVEWRVTVIIPPLWYAPWTWRKETIMQFVGRGEDWKCVKVNNESVEPDTINVRRHVTALNAIVSDYATDWIPRKNNIRLRA